MADRRRRIERRAGCNSTPGQVQQAADRSIVAARRCLIHRRDECTDHLFSVERSQLDRAPDEETRRAFVDTVLGVLAADG